MSAKNKLIKLIVLTVVIVNSVHCFKNLDYAETPKSASNAQQQNGNSGILLNKIIKTPNDDNLSGKKNTRILRFSSFWPFS